MIKNKSNSRHYKMDLKLNLNEYSDDSQALYELLASESKDLNLVEQQIHKNKFYRWLNKDSSPFSLAKNKLINKEALLPETWTLQIPSQLEYKYTLEYICCQLVKDYLISDIMLNKMIALKSTFSQFKKSLESVVKHLQNPHLSFGNAVIEQLFKLAIDEVMNDDRQNIYTSRKNSPTLLRDTFTKRSIGLLYPYYHRYEDLNNNFIVDISIALTEQFFNTTSDNHLYQTALQIKEDFKENSLIMNMSVEQLLIHLHSRKKSRVQNP